MLVQTVVKVLTRHSCHREGNEMKSENKLSWLGGVLIVLVLSVSVAHALDMWENVLEMGLDDPRMNEAKAMAIHGSHIYVASIPDPPSPSDHARILRAPLGDDHMWSDFTRPGGFLPLGHSITDMISFNGRLFVSVSNLVWSLNDPGDISSWTRVRLPDPLTPILALGTVMRADTHRGMLCLLRGTTEVRTLCFFEDLGRWHEFSFPGTARPGTVGFASLEGQGQVMWAGLGGTTRTSGPCVVAKYANFRVRGGVPEVDSIDLLSRDCFGTGVAFVEIEVFRDTPYFGIAGGGPATSDFRIFRLDGGAAAPRDVTPWELFCPALGGAPCELAGGVPAAVGSMAVSGGGLYLGIRQPAYIPRDALVIVTGDGDNWTESNEPGFGRDRNANVTAMTGRGCALYAGTDKTHNPVSPELDGFEVWRRGLPLSALHCIGDIERDVGQESQGLQRCLLARVRPSIPAQFEVICLPDFLQLAASIEDIDFAFATAFVQDPQEQMLKDESRKMLSPAFLELEKAKELVAQEDLAKSPKVARQLGQQAIIHVREAVHIAHTTVVGFKTALQHAGGKGADVPPQEPPGPDPKP